MYELSVKILQAKLDADLFEHTIIKDRYDMCEIRDKDNKNIKSGNIDEIGSFIDGLIYGKKYFSQR